MFSFATIAWLGVQTTLLFCLGLVFAWMLRGRYPQWTAAFLSGVCIAALCLAALALTPKPHWSIVELLRKPLSDVRPTTLSPREATTTPIETPAVLPVGTQVDRVEGLDPLRQWIIWQIQWMDDSIQTLESSASNAVPSSRTTGGSQVALRERAASTIVDCVGIGVCIFAICSWSLGVLTVIHLRRQARPIHADDIQRRIDNIGRRMRLKKLPTVCESARVGHAATVGWLRPLVLLNPDWREWSETQLQVALAHELAHVARRDFVWAFLGAVMRGVFCLHPLAHLVVSRLRLEQELAADQLAAGTMSSSRVYGRTLAELSLRQTTRSLNETVLAAGETYLIRRIEMLKQGSLRPRVAPMRTAGWVILVTALAAAPLAGLRGQDGQITENQRLRESIDLEEIYDKERLDRMTEDQKQKSIESIAAAKKFEPLDLHAAFAYRENQFGPRDVGPILSTIVRFYQVMLQGDVMSEATEAFGQATARLQWLDLNKDRGALFTSIEVRHANSNEKAGLFSRPLSIPAVTRFIRSDETVQIEGQAAVGYGTRGRDNKIIDRHERPFQWVVDNESGFFRGTQAEVARLIRSPQRIHRSIPADMLDDYDAAGLAVVADCRTWYSSITEFSESSRNSPFAGPVVGAMAGLEDLGLFVLSNERVRVRASYDDAAAAVNAKTILDATLATASASAGGESDATNSLQRWVAGLAIERTDAELKLEVDLRPIAELLGSSLDFPEELGSDVDRWTCFGETHFLRDESSSDPASPTVVLIGMPTIPHMPITMFQSIDASAFRGTRIRFVAELASPQGEAERSGLVAWAGGRIGGTNASNSVSIDGRHHIESVFDEPRRWNVQEEALLAADVAEFKRVSIELDVPINAEVVNVGCYLKNSPQLRFRLPRLKIVDGSHATATHSTDRLLDAYSFPARQILNSPDFRFAPRSSERLATEQRDVR